MTVRDTKAVIQRYFEQAPTNTTLIDELVAEDFVFHYNASPLPLGDAEMKQLLGVTTYDPPAPGRRQLKTLFRLLYIAFPDWRYSIEDLVISFAIFS